MRTTSLHTSASTTCRRNLRLPGSGAFGPHPDTALGTCPDETVVHIDDLRTRPAYLGRSGHCAARRYRGARTVAHRADAQGRRMSARSRIYRRKCAVHRKADRLVEQLRQPGRDCDRERAAAQRIAGATDELSKSLDDLRTAQDRLVQTEKLASLGQLTAGIAHEIKNPLNFVNNFAALSAELTDEMNDVLKPVDDRPKRSAKKSTRLTGMLKDNLRKGRPARQARQLHRQEHAAAFARGLRRAPARRHQRAGRRKPQPRLSRRPRREAGLQRQAAARLRCRRRHDRGVSAGNHPRVPQSGLERLLCRDQAQAESGESGFDPMLRATTEISAKASKSASATTAPGFRRK